MSSRNRTEKLSTKEKLTKVAAGTLIALGAVGLSACAPNNTEAQPTPPVVTETAEPTPTEAPIETDTSPYFGTEVTIDQVQQYMDMSPEVFAQKPVEERVLVAMYLSQGAVDFPTIAGDGEDIRLYANEYYSVSKNPTDKLPEKPSLDNTPEEALAIVNSLNRMTISIPHPDNSSSLDVDKAILLNSAIRFKGLASPQFFKYQDFIVSLNGSVGPRAMAVKNNLAAQKVITTSELTQDQNNYSYYEYVVEGEEDGSTITTRAYWVPVGGSGIWIGE